MLTTTLQTTTIHATARTPPANFDIIAPLLLLAVGLLCLRSKRAGVFILGCFIALAAIFSILQL